MLINVRHVPGICDLLANIMKQIHGLDVNPLTDIAICCGQSEAFAAAAFASMLPHHSKLHFHLSPSKLTSFSFSYMHKQKQKIYYKLKWLGVERVPRTTS